MRGTFRGYSRRRHRRDGTRGGHGVQPIHRRRPVAAQRVRHRRGAGERVQRFRQRGGSDRRERARAAQHRFFLRDESVFDDGIGGCRTTPAVHTGRHHADARRTPRRCSSFHPGRSTFQSRCASALGGLQLIITQGAQSTTITVQIRQYSPALFTINAQGTGQASTVIAGTANAGCAGRSIPGARPAKPGEFLSIYCTGLGDVSNRPVLGAASPPTRWRRPWRRRR